MKLKMRILMLMGSLILLVFAVNVGIASAHEVPPDSGDPGDCSGPQRPVGDSTISECVDGAPSAPDGTIPGAPGAENGFGFDFGGGGIDFENPAVIAIAHNPLCPLHDGGLAIHPPGNP